MGRRKGFGPWLATLVLLVVLGGGVPYGFLADQRNWFTALFWLAFGLAVVVVVAAGTRHWKDR